MCSKLIINVWATSSKLPGYCTEEALFQNNHCNKLKDGFGLDYFIDQHNMS